MHLKIFKNLIWNITFSFCLKYEGSCLLILCGMNVAWPQPCLYGTEWAFLARDVEERVQLPPTSEVPGRFEGQHMWQMGSKLETLCLLYFHFTPSLQLYTPVLQMEKEKKCLYVYVCEKLDIKISPLCLKVLNLMPTVVFHSQSSSVSTILLKVQHIQTNHPYQFLQFI